jgi:hypothetical protein
MAVSPAIEAVALASADGQLEAIAHKAIARRLTAWMFQLT